MSGSADQERSELITRWVVRGLVLVGLVVCIAMACSLGGYAGWMFVGLSGLGALATIRDNQP